jgi:hypothetical protein
MNWTNVTSVVIALAALLVSLCSFIVAFRAFRLAQKQDDRKRPSLVPSLLNGYVQFRETQKVRVYAFLLSVSNPSDSNNSLAKLELHISYRTPAQTLVTAQVPSSQSRGDAYAELPEFSSLSTPARLDAHQTLTGWAVFRVSEAILKDTIIERYSVALFDSHNIKTSVEPIMVQEYIRETVPPLWENPSPQ